MAKRKSGGKPKHETIKKESKEISFKKTHIMIIAGVLLLIIAVVIGIVLIKSSNLGNSDNNAIINTVVKTESNISGTVNNINDPVSNIDKVLNNGGK